MVSFIILFEVHHVMCTLSLLFKRRAMLCGAMLVFWMGCSSHDNENSPDGAADMSAAPSGDMTERPSLKIQEAISALIDIQVRHTCTQNWMCPADSYSDLPFLGRHHDQNECEVAEHNIVLDFLKTRYERLSRQVDAQNMRYDGANAYSCVTASMQSFDETLCTQSVLKDPSCDGIFTGLLTPGASCVEQDECLQGTTCEESLSLISCTGQCTACGVETCDEVGTYCRRGGGSSACEPTKNPGEPCDENEMCGDLRKYGCLMSSGEADGECIELGMRASGATCSDDTHCARGLTCRDAVCEQVVLMDSGEPCSIIDVQTGLCKPGLVCAQAAPGEPALCTQPRQLDEPCTSLLQCVQGLQCEESEPGDSRTGTCRALRADDVRCELPFECESKRCIVLAPTRGVCASEVGCE